MAILIWPSIFGGYLSVIPSCSSCSSIVANRGKSRILQWVTAIVSVLTDILLVLHDSCSILKLQVPLFTDAQSPPPPSLLFHQVLFFSSWYPYSGYYDSSTITSWWLGANTPSRATFPSLCAAAAAARPPDSNLSVHFQPPHADIKLHIIHVLYSESDHDSSSQRYSFISHATSWSRSPVRINACTCASKAESDSQNQWMMILVYDTDPQTHWQIPVIYTVRMLSTRAREDISTLLMHVHVHVHVHAVSRLTAFVYHHDIMIYCYTVSTYRLEYPCPSHHITRYRSYCTIYNLKLSTSW